MPSGHAFAIYIPAALVLLAIPGPAVLYVIATSVEGGRRAGLLSVAGVHVGSIVHVAAACAGLSALIVSSAIAFSTVKYVGAAYLVFIGIKKLLDKDDPPEEIPRPPRSGRRIFTQGIVVNVLNPKTALFFLAFLPQFVDPDRGPVALQAAVLGASFVVLAVLSDSTYAVVAAALAGRVRGSRRAQQVRRYVSGTIFVALGVTAAAARRT